MLDAQPINRVLITGGCGYLGASLIRLLPNWPATAGCTVRILDNMQSRSFQALTNLSESCRFEFIEGDILDRATVRAALRDVNAVVHLAAIVRTAMSFDNPAWLGQVNHWGTAHLLEACLDAGIERFVYASSTSVYGPGEASDEVSSCQPLGPYAQSKRNAEIAVLTAMTRGLDATVLRLGTLYGYSPSTRYDAFVNRLIYLAATGQAVTVYGSGEQTRPVVHVDDAARAFAFCLSGKAKTTGEIYNVLESNPTVMNVLDVLGKLIPGIRVRYTDQDAMLSQFSFLADNAKILQAGWRPEISLFSGIRDMVGRFANIYAALPENDTLVDIV